MMRVVLLGLVLSGGACEKKFGDEPEEDAGPSGAEAVAAYCMKLRSCFGDTRPVSTCILLEARDTSVSPFLRPRRVEGGTPREQLSGADWWERFLQDRKGCIERAPTCEEAANCGNPNADVCGDMDDCDPDLTAWRCRSGDNLCGCHGESAFARGFRIRCNLQSLDCYPDTDASAACGVGTCLGDNPHERCDSPLCDGDVLLVNWTGIVQSVACGSLGRRCGPGWDGALTCRGHGADCDGRPAGGGDGFDALNPMAPARCEDGMAVFCDGGGETRLDCRASDMLKGCTDGAPGGCTPTAVDCDPRTYVGECQGTAVPYCENGTVTTVDCSTIGLESCAMVAGAPACQ